MTQAFNLSQFANYLNSSGQVSASGLQTGVGGDFPSGTVVLLYQASAPTGWTQVTSLNDYALRLVSSAGGSTGGTTAFSTVFANQTPTISGSFTVGSTTLSTTQIPSHAHGYATYSGGGCGSPTAGAGSTDGSFGGNGNTFNTGSGGSHTHSISGSPTSSAITLNVRYANIIICSKN
jgi:hypothetical protein